MNVKTAILYILLLKPNGKVYIYTYDYYGTRDCTKEELLSCYMQYRWEKLALSRLLGVLLLDC